jgi:hypothetical protein
MAANGSSSRLHPSSSLPSSRVCLVTAGSPAIDRLVDDPLPRGNVRAHWPSGRGIAHSGARGAFTEFRSTDAARGPAGARAAVRMGE